jgi:TRAP-type C4-dicarboxylate transport system substrate-binding protein
MTHISRRHLLQALPAAALALPAGLTLPWLPEQAWAGASRLRFATLVPRGSLYHRVLLEVGEAWRHAEGGDATFTVFTDGVQGDEGDLVRRMRIGQLSGAMMSVIGLSEIDEGATALQYMPLMFRSWDEVDVAGRLLRPMLEKRMAERGFIVLYWGEAGWVRFFTKVPAVRPGEFKPLKMYAWSGTPAQTGLMKALGYQPVVLETADILPGLQTGLLDAVPLIPTWALAAQIDTVAHHMLEMRWVPIVGAAVISQKAWDALSPAGQAALRQASVTASSKLRDAREPADREAIDAMRKRGLQVHTLTPEADAEWQQLVATSYPRIRGNMVPADVFDTVQKGIAEYRSAHASS